MLPITGDDDPNTIIGTKFDDEIEALGGDDFVEGKAGNDLVFGGTDEDILFGGRGDDWVSGGEGDDELFGDKGLDTLDYSKDPRAIEIDLALGTVTDGFEDTDIFEGFENVAGTRFDDRITGDAGANVIYGNRGDDFIASDGGDDTVFGGGGDDNINGFYGNDIIHGGRGDDRISGYDDDDILFGEGGDDDIFGSGGATTVYGGSGDDKIRGGLADNANDVLSGGEGNDIFSMDNAFNGDDTIIDFEATGNDSPFIDRIELRFYDGVLDSFADVEARSTQDGDDLVIDLGNDATLRLENITIDDLDADDFIFV